LEALLKTNSLFAIVLILSGCPETPTQGPVDAGTSDAGAAPLGYCAANGLTEKAFSAEAPTAFQRRQPAGDFSVPLPYDETFTLSERWSGCDSYVFLPNNLPISRVDPTSAWGTDFAALIGNSPRNVHYFFVIAGNGGSAATRDLQGLRANIEIFLATLSDDDYDHWLGRLHTVRGNTSSLEDGLVKSMFATPVGVKGWAIDRFQNLRGLGSLADVNAYSQGLKDQDMWPWEARLFSLGFEAQYFNFEADRQQRLDAEEVTEITVFDGSVIEQFGEASVSLPAAATMAGFDTMEFDILMECPNKEQAEFGNCGAWDYLAHVWLRDEADENWLEMGRAITTYHRESRWLIDASWALAWLQSGGERRIKYEWAPSWNKQPTGVTFKLRLSNQGKGVAARSLVPIFTGGPLNSTSNERDAALFNVPADATKVELVVLTTGHGMDAQNCAEFCAHSHHFTLAGTTFDQEFPDVGNQSGCAETSNEGTTPNQGGTWWFGRGGWCPGQMVTPFIRDLTPLVSAGSEGSISYEAKINGRAPFDNAGKIELRAYAVFYH
jgi:hypothetical protein